jgi:pyruvate/2-oxoglutarate dehydrogenase complex dihydrolipoamide acyltransferase (E2) component
LGQIQGSGPHGRVMKEDLQGQSKAPGVGAVSAGAAIPARAKSTRPHSSGGEERVPFRGLRKKISEKMRLSKDKAAHFTYVEEADATQLVALRDQAKVIAAQQGVKLTYLPFIMKAMVAALRKYPILNSTLDEAKGEIVYKYDYNIGLSVQTDDGLTAPVVKDVAHKSVMEIARDIQDLVERARSKRLTMDDLQGSTITLTNAGSIGGLFATPVINYPEVAILGFNKIARKPVVVKNQGREEIVIRDWTYFSISLDHRIVDGAIGAEFMKTFIQFVENPTLLLLESF